MFTGIITHQAILNDIIINKKQDVKIFLSLKKNQIKRQLKIGCSVCCNGICLTLISQKNNKTTSILEFAASNETCQKTTIKNWQIGQKINLEFSMRLNDEFGGHLVAGHVDTVSKVINIKTIKDSWRIDFSIPQGLNKFIANKGSITINGTSLTINDSNQDSFCVNIISHTMRVTNFGDLKIGDQVNIEIDLIARYLSKLIN